MSTTSQFSADDKNIRIHRVPREVDFDASPEWSSYAQLMSEYDAAMVRGWKEEIDTLLVFAGLFSAVVTAFNIEAYKLLQDDPVDTSIQLLQQISRQLANGTDVSSIVQARPPFRPAGQSIRINALWFASLVCALFSALIGIIVKQWLREYMAVISPSPRHSVQLRQHRHDGLKAWHVPEIMAFLPILLEISLILFLAGLVDFLLLLNSTVAAITTALVTAALLFYVGTTIAPLLSTQCPFKSPQAWVLVRTQRWVAQWIRALNPSGLREPQPLQEFANWSERDNNSVECNRDALDLKAMTWVHASFVDDDIQDSLVSVISELKPHHATSLVVTALADEMDLSAPTFSRLIRDRSCSSALRDTGARIAKRTRTRVFNMLLKLLEYIPRDHDPSQFGVLDVLWVLWELCVGACNAEDQDPLLYQSILNGMAELLSEGEPFRLRRAALNLLYESTHTWTYMYCPSAVGNIIAFARTCFRHDFRDMSVKATTVALLLSPGLDWDDDETMPHHRQQLVGLLRDLSRFLQQCNEDGIRYAEERSANKLVYGIAVLAEKDEGLVNELLPRVLLEGAELGLLDLSQEERVMLKGVQETRFVHGFERSRRHVGNGFAV